MSVLKAIRTAAIASAAIVLPVSIALNAVDAQWRQAYEMLIALAVIALAAWHPDYNTAVGEREAAKTALAASERQRGNLVRDNGQMAQTIQLYEADNAKLNRDIETLALNLANAREENGRLGRQLTKARELLMRADRDHEQLSGQLADAKAQLASYTLAETIADETRAKRYYDGRGDE